jgi:hypothetical protein
MVVGIMRDKDADGILRELLPVTSMVVATAATPAAPCPRRLARGICARPAQASSRGRRGERRLDAALPRAAGVRGGVLFLVGEVRDASNAVVS